MVEQLKDYEIPLPIPVSIVKAMLKVNYDIVAISVYSSKPLVYVEQVLSTYL
jgi:hypothetical protein